MNQDDSNSTGAAAARARDESVPPNEHPLVIEPEAPQASISQTNPVPTPEFDALLPEDLRVPWTWTDLLLFLGLGLAGLVVVGLIVVGVAVFFLGVPRSDFNADSASSAKSGHVLVSSQAIWSVFAMLYFFVMLRLRGSSPFWKTMGWRKLHFEGQPTGVTIGRFLGAGAVLAIMVSYASRFLGDTGELPIEEMFKARPTVIALMAFGILVAPLVEEMMFRGFLYPLIARRFGVGSGIVVTGLLFGAMHAQQLGGAWGQVSLLMGVGIILTWVRAKTGSVTASYLVHLGYNSLLFLGFFLATSGA